jgi:hypothetical protein
VRAGVPTHLDDVAGRALALPGRDEQAAFESPAELAAALSAAIPPLQVPLATVTPVRGDRNDADRLTQTQRPQRQTGRIAPPAGPPVRRRGAGRVTAISVLVLVAVVGASAAAVHLLTKSPSSPSAGRSSTTTTQSPAAATIITPASAHGFDALNPADGGDENSNQAANVLDGNSAGWATQQYFTSNFGNLKAGTGLILDLGRPVRVGSITVTFGSVPGANVQIKMGASDTRSAANLASMTTVASMSDVSGSTTFTVRHPVTDQYLVIWFTKLPPMQGGNRYMAQIFGVAIHGAS